MNKRFIKVNFPIRNLHEITEKEWCKHFGHDWEDASWQEFGDYIGPKVEYKYCKVCGEIEGNMYGRCPTCDKLGY